MNTLTLEDLNLCCNPDLFSAAEADRLFGALQVEANLQQRQITLYGKTVPLPRLTAWHGDPGASYTYSGILNSPAPWTPAILAVKAAVEAATGAVFNGVLLNQYRDGKDSVGWHSDDEAQMSGLIASVSLGGVRNFQVRRKPGKGTKIHSLPLTPGSLLVMPEGMQQDWLHQVPRTSRSVQPRINLTFRQVLLGLSSASAVRPFLRF